MNHSPLRVAVTALSLAFVFAAATADAQEIKKGTLSGTIISAGADVLASSSAVVIGPTTGPTIITQVCTEDPNDVDIVVSTSGPIVQSDNGNCTTYVPGIAIPLGETVSCVNGSTADRKCSVTGVRSKK